MIHDFDFEWSFLFSRAQITRMGFPLYAVYCLCWDLNDVFYFIPMYETKQIFIYTCFKSNHEASQHRLFLELSRKLLEFYWVGHINLCFWADTIEYFIANLQKKQHRSSVFHYTTLYILHQSFCRPVSGILVS